MNFSPSLIFRKALYILMLSLGLSVAALAENSYTEFEFVKEFSGKDAAYILDKLGEPDQKDARKNEGGKVEFWTYKNLVKIGNSDKTYKYTQFGIVNDAVETLGNTNREPN